MKITVITVCFNSEKAIGDTLKSVACQRGANVDYIIVDGMSKDSTWEIINRRMPDLPQGTVLIREKDSGIYDAMNKGIARATGDIVGFLNSDDVFADPFSLSRIAAAFQSPLVEMVYGDLIYTKENDLDQTTRTWKLGPMPALRMKTGWHPAHPTMYVRRDIIQREPFNLSFPIAGDYEMMVRLIEKRKLRSQYIPHTLVRMREGGASNKNLKNILKANIECLRAWSKNGLIANPLTIALKLGRKILQY